MNLSLSSAAAPTLGFEALLDACERRGLRGIELVEGNAHGVRVTDSRSVLASLRSRADERGIAIVSYRLAAPADPDVTGAQRILEVLGAPVFRPGAGLATAVVSDPTNALCWQAEPALGDLTPQIPATIRAADRNLACVRLCGGGPESAQWTGRGIGTLMVALAMSGFAGNLILAPSAPGMVPVWRTWLGRSTGTGCGSREADPNLVQMAHLE